ncbi:MAG TPA: hypothetical protein PLS30_07890 [Flavobacteriales bacterium]|jgi:hypothetical protein|nr:hypothetical protein [Flavobacteriales bacterium]MBK7618550.1 hypothetical protein [Flavobacteriales bacterium]HQW98862.1 hypothetical protein [Flavobacteriales bacterium]
MSKHFITFLSHTCKAIPVMFEGSYSRGSAEYHKRLAHYYPSDGVIDIGSFGYDLASYLGDYATVFNLYKRNTARAIVKSSSEDCEHGEAAQEVERWGRTAI